MAIFMEQHNRKQREILQNVPGKTGIGPGAAADFKCGHQKPRPMQEHINARDAKQVNRALAHARHR